MIQRSTTVLASVAILALLLGCGSSESDETLTKAEFIKRGDAVCTQANKQSAERYSSLAKQNVSNGSKRSVEEEGIEVGEEVLVPNAEWQAEGLAELSPPEGDETEVDAIVSSIEEGVKQANADPSSFYGKDYPFDEANRLMRDYGFQVCGRTNPT